MSSSDPIMPSPTDKHPSPDGGGGVAKQNTAEPSYDLHRGPARHAAGQGVQVHPDGLQPG